MFRSLLQKTKKQFSGPMWQALADLQSIRFETEGVQSLAVIAGRQYVRDLLSAERHQDPLRLVKFGFKVFSQSDEDGIIEEIFRRIGKTSKTFVEFGVEGGNENNTLKLLLEGWRGLWLEGSSKYVSQIETKFSDVLQTGQLSVKCAFLDKDNINGHIGDYFEGEIDLLSIDIDGNDIYIFDTINVVNPRVIIVEYNAKFPPSLSVAQAYNSSHRWKGTDYMGASLAAITKLANQKGYALVGCNILGANSFFVRHDLVGDRFCAPYTAENHFEPARYFLMRSFVSGHAPDWGPYVQI